jgi:hypothetical protein
VKIESILNDTEIVDGITAFTRLIVFFYTRWIPSTRVEEIFEEDTR